MEKIKQWIVSHKLWSIVIASALVVCITLAIVLPITLSHKDEDKGDVPVTPLHEHTCSEEWSVDANYHWHICMGEDCNAKVDNAEHFFGADGKCTACNKKRLNLRLEIPESVSSDVVAIQRDWIICDDSDYKDPTYYGFEYFVIDGYNYNPIESFPTDEGVYRVKLTFDGDETYLPTEAVADFIVG